MAATITLISLHRTTSAGHRSCAQMGNGRSILHSEYLSTILLKPAGLQAQVLTENCQAEPQNFHKFHFLFKYYH